MGRSIAMRGHDGLSRPVRPTLLPVRACVWEIRALSTYIVCTPLACYSPHRHHPSAHLQPLLLSPYICALPSVLDTSPSPTISAMSAITETRQSVYVSDGFSEPMGAQHNFANNFDLNDPERAMSEYQRYVSPSLTWPINSH